jgi:Nuclease-related domain
MFQTKKKKEKHSPLKETPLRRAGQSLEKEIKRVKDKVMEYFTPLIVVIVFIGYEWMRLYMNKTLHPLGITILAVPFLIYLIIKIKPLFVRLKNLRLGLKGERVMGEWLENLHSEGFKVLHDIPNDKGNIDHVLIGPKGIFTIETKTISKPIGKSDVKYDGSVVSVNGLPFDSKPVNQAKAESYWIKDRLKSRMGRDFSVRAVLIYMNWFITGHSGGKEVWVLNQKSFHTFLGRQTSYLEPEDINLIYSNLSDYVRNYKK